ncbi:MAG: pentapeptide repeat-containing protein [Candidatus Aminicenantales bacterium]|jgi:uncharacterized protein YjbI with pentapeptide repeats
MAESRFLKILKEGTPVWNRWRNSHPRIKPDLSGADLTDFRFNGIVNFNDADLSGADLRGRPLFRAQFQRAVLKDATLNRADLRQAVLSEADLSGADLGGTDLQKADLKNANLRRAKLQRASLNRANLERADLGEADLKKADLSEADLFGANLSGADFGGAVMTGGYLFGANLTGTSLRRANLKGANLQQTILVETDLSFADISGCSIYGVSVWNAKLEQTVQKDLLATPTRSPSIIVDHIEMAQFIYLLINNSRIQKFARIVLVLGHFEPKRRELLEAIRDQVRKSDYVPLVFDHDDCADPGLQSTLSNLARMARFVIMEMTDQTECWPATIALLHKLAVPVKPLLMGPADAMAKALPLNREKSQAFLDVYCYENAAELSANFRSEVILQAEARLSAAARRA